MTDAEWIDWTINDLVSQEYRKNEGMTYDPLALSMLERLRSIRATLAEQAAVITDKEQTIKVLRQQIVRYRTATALDPVEGKP